ncbi:MAG: response regulator [Campylobacterales bacterium]|nr:response regulator [Campylobacterales bacterium]
MDKPLILLVDDEPINLKTVGEILRQFYRIMIATGGEEALNALEKRVPELILLDIVMPKMDGLTLAKQLKSNPQTAHIPIIFLTSNNDKPSIVKAKSLGIDYLLKPVEPFKLQQRLRHALVHVKVDAFFRLYHDAAALLERFFKQRTPLLLHEIDLWVEQMITFNEAHSQLSAKYFLDHLPQSYNDPTHNVNVAILSLFLGRALHFSHHQLSDLITAALLHDIGKITIDPTILHKEGALDWHEYLLVQKHAQESVTLARQMGIKKSPILEAILHHHEKLDGSGYPSGLAGNQISLFAQVIGVCDVFDALSTQRTFRERYNSYDALMLMLRDMPQQLNIQYIQKLISLLH